MSLHTTPRSAASARSFALMLLGFAFALAQAPAFAAATTPAAPLERLSCGGSNTIQDFNMVLEPMPYGYYHVRSATLVAGFTSARLICYSRDLGEYNCVGYWFGLPDRLVEVQVKHQPDGSRVAISKSDRGDETMVCGAQTPITNEASFK